MLSPEYCCCSGSCCESSASSESLAAVLAVPSLVVPAARNLLLLLLRFKAFSAASELLLLLRDRLTTRPRQLRGFVPLLLLLLTLQSPSSDGWIVIMVWWIRFWYCVLYGRLFLTENFFHWMLCCDSSLCFGRLRTSSCFFCIGAIIIWFRKMSKGRVIQLIISKRLKGMPHNYFS